MDIKDNVQYFGTFANSNGNEVAVNGHTHETEIATYVAENLLGGHRQIKSYPATCLSY